MIYHYSIGIAQSTDEVSQISVLD